MSDPSRSLMESGEGARTILDESYVHTLDRKWGQLLEGIPGRNAQERHTRAVTAMLMENQAQHLRGLTEETRSLNVGSFF